MQSSLKSNVRTPGYQVNLLTYKVLKHSEGEKQHVIHTATKDNPRIFNISARGSRKWKEEYKARTSAERDNKRIKNDFLLESGSHRSSKMWYCRLYCILMCCHLNAWDLPYESQLDIQLQQVV